MVFQTITISFDSCELQAHFARHTASKRRGCVFYFHGGGLVCGTSKDLPRAYLAGFLAQGYDFISIAYPLAPESRLPEITRAAFHGVAYLLENPELLGYDTMPPYFLFGRSAGAYLALTAAHRLALKHAAADGDSSGTFPFLPLPAGILSFYGYHTFALPEFRRPVPAYQKLPAVSPEMAAGLTENSPLTEDPLFHRYPIYLYARQSGTWLELLGGEETVAKAAIPEEDLALLPPCFLTASSGDQDVPFKESKTLTAKIPGSKFHPVYFLPHDFDRDTKNPEGARIYEKAFLWMNEKSS